MEIVLSRIGSFFFLAAILGGTHPGLSQEPIRELAPLLEGNSLNLRERIVFEPTEATGRGRTFWSKAYEQPGSDYIAISFSEINEKGGSYNIELVDERDGSLISSVSSDDFRRSDTYTTLIPSSHIGVKVVAVERPIGLSFVIDNIVYQQRAGVVSSIVEPDEREHAIMVAQEDPVLAAAMPSVAKIVVIRGGNSYSCTGFMVGMSEILTNEHCFKSPADCKNTFAQFGFEYNLSGILRTPDVYRCTEFIGSDYSLDYALLRLSGNANVEAGARYGVLSLSEESVKEGQELRVVGHPAGEPKQISRKGCRSGAVSVEGRDTGTDVQHSCDTLGGNSGSPILDAAGNVVALHHYGFNDAAQGPKWNQAVNIMLVKERIGM